MAQTTEQGLKQAAAVLARYLSTVPQGIREEIVESIVDLMSLCLQAIERMWPACPACGGALLRREGQKVVCALCNKEYSICSECE